MSLWDRLFGDDAYADREPREEQEIDLGVRDGAIWYEGEPAGDVVKGRSTC
jgi:hypothetical protein